MAKCMMCGAPCSLDMKKGGYHFRRKKVEQKARADEREAAVTTFAEQILHGDEAHQRWLKDAAAAFIAGNPLPPLTGQGSVEKARAEEREACAKVAEQGHCTAAGCDPRGVGHTNLCPLGIAAAIRARK